jgi:hypothetical protein
MADNYDPDCKMCGGEGIPYYALNPTMMDPCRCDTEAVLEKIAARWSQIGPMGEVRTDQDYTDEGCRILARHAFAEVNYLIALLAFTALPKENS